MIALLVKTGCDPGGGELSNAGGSVTMFYGIHLAFIGRNAHGIGEQRAFDGIQLWRETLPLLSDTSLVFVGYHGLRFRTALMRYCCFRAVMSTAFSAFVIMIASASVP